jgi:hypothetical protein
MTRTRFLIRCLSVLAPLLWLAPELWAQQPILSPRDSVQIRFNGKPSRQNGSPAAGGRIFVDYGRPSTRGRVIMGGLVPYNKWWRTGANEATSFVTDMDLRLGDTVVPRGSYTLYTLPSAKQWKLMINRQTGQWGTVYDPSLDLVRLPMKKRMLKNQVEKFTILLERSGPRSGLLRMRWERTEVYVPFTVLENGAPSKAWKSR